MENLNEFKVNKIDFDLAQMRLNITFTWEKVRAIGNYNMDSVMDDDEFWGDGPFEMIAHSKTHYSENNPIPLRFILFYRCNNGCNHAAQHR